MLAYVNYDDEITNGFTQDSRSSMLIINTLLLQNKSKMFSVLAQHTIISNCLCGESPWDRSMAGVSFSLDMVKNRFMFKLTQASWHKQLNFNYWTEGLGLRFNDSAKS